MAAMRCQTRYDADMTRNKFLKPFGALLFLSLCLPACSGDPLDAAEEVDDIPLDRKLSDLRSGDAQALCAKRFVVFGGDKGLQCDGVIRKHKLGTMDSCVQELDKADCPYTVGHYRSCGEPKAGQSPCDFASTIDCVNLNVDCKLKARSR